MTQQVYILSTGRTGTQFLAKYFDANFPQVWALHEPKPSYLLRMISNAYAAGRVSTQFTKRVFEISRRSIFSRLDSIDTYMESNPFLYGLADVLPQIVNDPMILHITRDPRTYVRSAINHGGAHGIKQVFASLFPFWATEVHDRRRFRSMLEAITSFSRQWHYVNQKLSAASESISRYHLIRYEDIFDARNSGLHRICELLHLDYPGLDSPLSPGQRINRSRYEKIERWEMWTTEQQQSLLDICYPLMNRYNYTLESSNE